MRTITTLIALTMLAALCQAGMLAWAARADSAWSAAMGHTYTVAEVRTLLAQHSDTWSGRTIRVSGVVSGCPYRLPGPCASWQPELRDPQTRSTRAGEGLLLVPVPARPNALRALLGRIPWVRALVYGPQAVRWDVEASYRVQLQSATTSQCGSASCYTALMYSAPD